MTAQLQLHLQQISKMCKFHTGTLAESFREMQEGIIQVSLKN